MKYDTINFTLALFQTQSNQTHNQPVNQPNKNNLLLETSNKQIKLSNYHLLEIFNKQLK